MDTIKSINWSLKKIATALREEKIDDVKIEVPMFQRNLVWTKDQKEKFIDSVKNGFPIGTLLFYNKESEKVYSLIDGLQRSTTVGHFIDNPTQYFRAEDAADSAIDNLFILFKSNENKSDFSDKIRCHIQEYLKDNDLFYANLIFELAIKLIESHANVDNSEFKEVVQKTVTYITPCITEFKELYEEIARTEIPIIVYSGSESNLPTIFERINNQGTILDKYQIYAASWAVQNYVVKVENQEIIDHILKKYDSFVDAGYTLQGYDKDEILTSKKLSIFEYVLGFGKYISTKYPNLFEQDKSIQAINQVGFELINACLGRTMDEIKTLNEKLHVIDINLLEKKIIESIDYVDTILAPYIKFKGNSRDTVTIYHSAYQIVSIIVAAFRERYDMNKITIKKKDLNDNITEDINPCAFTNEKSTWANNKLLIKVRIPQYYFYDIVCKNWADGNVGKLNSIVRENKYIQNINFDLWESKLDDWHVGMLTRCEKKNVAKPTTTEKLFLNIVHCKYFSSHDQLSVNKFDIEHLATKEQLKKIVNQHNWDGLPISAVGNICYLPEYDNRKKKDKTIYQDNSYIEYLSEHGKSVKFIEDKYTFTKEKDMSWLNKAYSDDQYDEFLKSYCCFTESRFKKMKQVFYLSLGIIKKEADYPV